VKDLNRDMWEDDLTHLPAILKLHDLSKDPEAGGRGAFEARSRDNLANGSLHRHAFDATLVARLVDQTGLQILAMECLQSYQIILIATNPDSNGEPDNEAFLRDNSDFRRNSSFASNRSPTVGTQAA
jgi:hypothetical protein